MIEIPQQTVQELLQLGGQYLLPIAALLRALYNGYRQKLPEGITEIVAASFFTGLTALVDNQQINLQSIIVTILSNTVLMAGLLMFIVVYLLRLPNRGFVVDGIVGGFFGIVFWLAWVLLLGNDWPWWTIALTVAAGAGGFIALRIAMRVLATLVRIATYFLIAGIIAVIIGGGILAVQWLANAAV